MKDDHANTNRMDRRECLRKGAGILAAGAVLGGGVSPLSAEEESLKPVRIGVIGLGGRGRYLMRSLAANHPRRDHYGAERVEA